MLERNTYRSRLVQCDLATLAFAIGFCAAQAARSRLGPAIAARSGFAGMVEHRRDRLVRHLYEGQLIPERKIH